MFPWPSLEYPPLCCGQNRGLLRSRSTRRRKEGCKQMVLLSGSLWRLDHSCLRAGHRRTLLSQPKYLPAPCQVQPKNRRAAFLGHILGPGIHPGSSFVPPHPPPAPHASMLQAEQAPALEYFKAFFFFRKKALKSNSSCGGILPKCQHNLCYITGKCDNLNAWLLNVSGTEV